MIIILHYKQVIKITDLSNDNEDLMSTDIYVLSSVTIIKLYYRHKVEAIVQVQ